MNSEETDPIAEVCAQRCFLSKLCPSAERQSGGVSREIRETREKDLFSTSSHMGRDTDGENGKSDFLHKFNE